MKNVRELAEALQNNSRQLNQLIAGFNEEEFNRQPPGGGWTPGQITEHLLILDKFANQAMQGTTETLRNDRAADKKLELIRTTMQDKERHFKAPDMVAPPARHYHPETLLQQSNQERSLMMELCMTADLSALCTQFKHPAYGLLTRLEWIAFTIYHTERHLLQMSYPQ